MKKLNYQDPKMYELVSMLTALHFSFKQDIESIDISVPTNVEYRKLAHEVDKIFRLHKSPPLAVQFDHSSNVMSIFDTRQR